MPRSHKDTIMTSLLFEIGTEEIPAGYIDPAIAALAVFLKKELTAARVDFGEVTSFATPRRLCVRIADVAAMQRPETTELMGPPEKAAFDAEGKPGIPAVKFAEKAGIPLEEIEIRETPKGRYLFAKVEEKVLPVAELLCHMLPAAVRALTFPKTMRWADTELAFARPIQRFVALFGEALIPFEVEGIVSDRLSSGHRFHHPEPVSIQTPEQYEGLLKDAGVIADVQERKAAVARSVEEVAKSSGGRVLADEELLNIVTHLVEAPYPVMGSFDPAFLEVPREVLITSMREHQKYFAVEDEKGNLLPLFIAVNNTSPKDMDLVRQGHQRVLRARLSDARFFWETDKKATFDQWNEKLDQVLFQAKLGTMGEKVARIRSLCAGMGTGLGLDGDMMADLDRAASLCKADLASQMVYEFPEVQGIMGRAYALFHGEKERVALAIEDHYKPLGSGGKLPEDLCGIVLSMADKLDTLCGCFAVGLRPTGAADPFALRRATLGILQMLLDRNLGLSLRDLVSLALKTLGDKKSEDGDETVQAVCDFMVTRLANLLAEKGLSRESIAAVIAVESNHVPEVLRRVEALDRIKDQPDFLALAGAFKRASNLLKKAGDVKPAVDASLFVEPAEKALYEAFELCVQTVDGHMASSDLDAALASIATLRQPVDAFFDAVMVMAEDEGVKNNRLGLLASIAALFGRIADFSRLA